MYFIDGVIFNDVVNGIKFQVITTEFLEVPWSTLPVAAGLRLSPAGNGRGGKNFGGGLIKLRGACIALISLRLDADLIHNRFDGTSLLA